MYITNISNLLWIKGFIIYNNYYVDHIHNKMKIHLLRQITHHTTIYAKMGKNHSSQ